MDTSFLECTKWLRADPPANKRTRCDLARLALVAEVMISDLAGMVMDYAAEPRIKSPPEVKFGLYTAKKELHIWACGRDVCLCPPLCHGADANKPHRGYFMVLVGMHREGLCTDDGCDCLPDNLAFSLQVEDSVITPRAPAEMSPWEILLMKGPCDLGFAKWHWTVILSEFGLEVHASMSLRIEVDPKACALFLAYEENGRLPKPPRQINAQ